MNDRQVALTFDAEHPDRPTVPSVIESILDTLGREGVRATFFMQGRWVESSPDVASRIASEGHLVGNHSFYHARMPLLTDAGFRRDVGDAERVIVNQTGVDPRPWFRCPFGAGADDRRTHDILQELGYRNVGWNVEVEDWEPRHSGADLASAVVAGVERIGQGAIVLLHTWPRSTGEGLAQMVRSLRDRGFELVDVAQLAE